MWHDLLNSLEKSTSQNFRRNPLYDCLTANFYLKKALSEIDSYIDNFECPKKSIEYYTNHIFIHSLGYYSQNPSLSKSQLKDLDNLKNLGFAYSKLDDLLCKKNISPAEAKIKMKSILEFMIRGMDYFLNEEINKHDFVNQLNLVQDKKAYLINFLNMNKDMNYSKVDYLINFVNNKIN